MIHVIECDAFWNSAQTQNVLTVEEENRMGADGEAATQAEEEATTRRLVFLSVDFFKLILCCA